MHSTVPKYVVRCVCVCVLIQLCMHLIMVYLLISYKSEISEYNYGMKQEFIFKGS